MNTLEDFQKWIAWANDQTSFDYNGYRIYAPKRCMCCGVETSPSQWAYGRACGRCDTGACQSVKAGMIVYDHAQPVWIQEGSRILRPKAASEIKSIRDAGMQAYADAVGAKPLSET